jgi:hypothetical protein
MIEDRLVGIHKIVTFAAALLETVQGGLACRSIHEQVVGLAHVAAALIDQPDVADMLIDPDVALVIGNLNAGLAHRMVIIIRRHGHLRIAEILRQQRHEVWQFLLCLHRVLVVGAGHVESDEHGIRFRMLGAVPAFEDAGRLPVDPQRIQVRVNLLRLLRFLRVGEIDLIDRYAQIVRRHRAQVRQTSICGMIPTS